MDFLQHKKIIGKFCREQLHKEETMKKGQIVVENV